MKYLLSILNSKLFVALFFSCTSFFLLTGCEKSRLKARPGVATTPKNFDHNRNHSDDGYHHDDRYHGSPEYIPNEEDHRHRDDRSDEERREPPPPIPRESSDTIVDVPGTTVNPDSNNQRHTVKDPYKNSSNQCRSQECEDDKDDGRLPPEDIPDVKKPKPSQSTSEDLPPTPGVIVSAAPRQDAIPMEVLVPANSPVQNISETGELSIHEFNHFHMLLVLDPNALKAKSSPLRKSITKNIIKDFIKAVYETKGDLHYTLGILVATTDELLSGKFYKELKELKTSQPDSLDDILLPIFADLAQDFETDGNKHIPGGNPYKSLVKLIDSDPKSIVSPQFFAADTPTVVLAISNFQDACNVNFTPRDSRSGCTNQHNQKYIVKKLIERKVYDGDDAFFAPVTMKHINFLGGEGDNNMPFYYVKEKEDYAVIEDYFSYRHGKRFANQLTVKSSVINVPESLKETNDIIIRTDKGIDSECLKSGDRIYITHETQSFTAVNKAGFISTYGNTKAPACKNVDVYDMYNVIIDKLYEDDVYVLKRK